MNLPPQRGPSVRRRGAVFVECLLQPGLQGHQDRRGQLRGLRRELRGQQQRAPVHQLGLRLRRARQLQHEHG